jgi:hypothetical protein
MSLEKEDLMNTKQAIYDLYTVIFGANILFDKQCHLMDALFRGEKWTWNVVGISKEALQVMNERDFAHVKGLQRHHAFLSRRDMYKQMFMPDSLPESKQPLSYCAWCETHERGDRVILVTKSQNDQNAEVRDFIKIETQGRLFANQTIGFRYTKRDEKRYLMALWKHIEAIKDPALMHNRIPQD